MTRAERNTYANNYALLMDRMEKRFISKVYRVLRQQIKSFIHDAHYGLEYAERRLSTQRMDMQMASVIMNLYKAAAVMSDRRTRVTVREQKALTMGHSVALTAEIQKYFDQYLFDKVVIPISQTTKDIIARKIKQGQDEGWSVSKTLEEIGKVDMTRARARKIVRTETVRAVSLGSLLSAWNEPFYMTKEWVAVKDARTRHSHYNIDGQVRDLEKKFSNGLMFPGDPNGSAEETINCRCALAYEPKRDSRGKLIPKQPAARAGGSTGLNSSIVDILLGVGLAQLIENFIEP